MRPLAVADSACLIGLERISRLDLVSAQFTTVLAPPAVLAEFGVPLPWLKPSTPKNTTLVAALRLQVESGESEAIALAAETSGAEIILDDRKARRIAGEMGLAIVGTVGLLLRGKRMGIIPAIAPVLDSLAAAGFFVAAELRLEALRRAGEQAPPRS
ncbi:MAG: hypothetical protein FD180_3777 [Planctomycetota bacterium]|nr:MAG: hypothetical protein FD180_3777 [Planctomycetota bacterium]